MDAFDSWHARRCPRVVVGSASPCFREEGPWPAELASVPEWVTLVGSAFAGRTCWEVWALKHAAGGGPSTEVP